MKNNITFRQFLNTYCFKEYDEAFPKNEGIDYIIVEILAELPIDFFKFKFGIEDYTADSIRIKQIDEIFNKNLLNKRVTRIKKDYNNIVVTLSPYDE